MTKGDHILELSLQSTRSIVAHALAWRRERRLKPLTVDVLDSCSCLLAIAQGKAGEAAGLGLGSRALRERAKRQPYFIQAKNRIASGSLVPVPGSVLFNSDGALFCAVGITGDTSDNDKARAMAAIESAGFAADSG